MRGESLILGISIGVVIGVLLAIFGLYCTKRRKKQINNSSSMRSATTPIRTNDVDTCIALSDSTFGPDSPRYDQKRVNGMSLWFNSFKKNNVVSVSGILEFPYRDLQKATQNFTTLIGQGAFGPVYKAQMSTGETVAVKVLATDSKQGAVEFETEVKMLGRLHHRNLLNLVGYCTDKGKNMLIYAYMSNGNLASHLYDGKMEPLSWDRRVHIALDVARGLEYLHDGAAPPVIHRDVKSSNILLDQLMRGRVADFGLSKEEMVDGHASHLRGTIGYLDPEYISSRTFTKKSDVYSYGVLLFELIAARSPSQGLMEYVDLATLNAEGGAGWEEIVDERLEGKFDAGELNEVAKIAYRCVYRKPKKRPSMRDTVQVLSRVLKSRHTKKHNRGTSFSETAEDVTIDIDQPGNRTSVSEHGRGDSIDSTDTDI